VVEFVRQGSVEIKKEVSKAFAKGLVYFQESKRFETM
jgi:hypothetical protein